MCEFNAKNKSQRFNCVCFHTPSTKGPYQLRSNSEWRLNAHKGKGAKNNWKGIKGPCQFMRLKYIDIPKFCVLDSMHAMYLGQFKCIVFIAIYSVLSKL